MKKRVVLWAVFRPGEPFDGMWDVFDEPPKLIGGAAKAKRNGVRVVKLLEHEPAAEAVVREAVKYINGYSMLKMPFAAEDLHAAVERLEKARARRGR